MSEISFEMFLGFPSENKLICSYMGVNQMEAKPFTRSFSEVHFSLVNVLCKLIITGEYICKIFQLASRN